MKLHNNAQRLSSPNFGANFAITDKAARAISRHYKSMGVKHTSEAFNKIKTFEKNINTALANEKPLNQTIVLDTFNGSRSGGILTAGKENEKSNIVKHIGYFAPSNNTENNIIAEAKKLLQKLNK